MALIRFIRAQWDRVTGAVCVLAGAAALIFGWVRVSSEIYPAAQFPYLISCGVGGLFLLGTGATLWLSADLRDEWRHLDRMEDRIAARVEARFRENDRGDLSGSDETVAVRPLAALAAGRAS